MNDVIIRAPLMRSKKSRIFSRSRKQYRNGELAPRSSAIDADEHQVRVDARQLGQQHPQHRGPLGDLAAEQLLDRQRVGQVVAQRIQVVHPIGQHDALDVGLGLEGLLDARVQVADDRPAVDDDFAVEHQLEPQHAVGRGVLRPHVDREQLALVGAAMSAAGVSQCHRSSASR